MLLMILIGLLERKDEENIILRNISNYLPLNKV